MIDDRFLSLALALAGARPAAGTYRGPGQCRPADRAEAAARVAKRKAAKSQRQARGRRARSR